MKNKVIICKHCQAVNSHYSFQCHTQRKPIGTVTDITEQWKAKQAKNKASKPRKKIPLMSESYRKRLAQYRVVRDEYFKENPVCQFPGCTSKDITLHHSKGKTGDLLMEKKWFKSLCMPHHNWAETHPLEAQNLGLSFKRLDK